MSKKSNVKNVIYFVVLAVLVGIALAAITEITPNTPLNDTWATDTTPTFNFTVYSNTSATNINCTLYINGAADTNKADCVNGSNLIVASNLTQGNHTWYVNCTDDAGVTFNSTVSRTIKIDSFAPTVAITMNDTSLIVGQTALVTFTFSEAVINFTNADVTTIDNGGLAAVASADGNLTWTAVFTPTDDLEDAINNITIGTAWADVAGNAPLAGNNSANYAIDTKEPTVTSATMNYSDNNRKLVVTFSEIVDASETVAAEFHLNNNTGADNVTLSAAPADVNADTLTFTLTEAQRAAAILFSGTAGGDGGAVVLDVDVGGIKDLAGNANVADDDANTVTETADANKPTISALTVNDANLSEADVAVGGFIVTINFSETMGTTYSPTVSFDPAVGTTLTNCGGVWTDADTFTYTCDIEDADITSANIDIDVSGAKDLAANTMLADTTSGVDKFSIDTVKPTVSSVAVDTLTLKESDLTQLVTVTYSEDMNTSVNATIAFSNGTWTPGAGSWTDATHFARTFTLTDNNEEFTNVDITVTAAKDVAGNTQTQGDGTDKFDIDTIAPVISVAGNITLTDVGGDGVASIGDTLTYAIGTVSSADGDSWTVDLSAYGLSATATAGAYVVVANNDDGAFSATETVKDNANNTDTGAVTLSGFTKIDNVAPIITVNGTLTLTDVGGDGVASIGDTLTYAGGTVSSADNDTWTVNLFAYGLSATAVPGAYVVIAGDDDGAFSATETVTDNASNTNTSTVTLVGFTNIDNVAPIITAAGTVTLTDVSGDGVASIGDTLTYAAGTVSSADGDSWKVNLSAYGLSATAVPGAYVIIADNDESTFNATETVKDNANNTDTGLVTLSGFTNIDDVRPTVTSATLNYNDSSRQLVVTFSEIVDANETDATKFHLNNNTGADNVTLSAAPANVNATTLTFTLTEAQRAAAILFSGTAGGDGGAVVLDVDAGGVKDLAGNTNLIDDNNAVAETADANKPTITALSVNDANLSEADVAVGGFIVTINFSETMGSTSPTVSFDPLVDTTLTNCNGVWTDTDTLTYTCDIEDANITSANIDIDVSGAKDLAANTMLADTTSGVDKFSIDTVKPTVSSITVDTSNVTESDLTQLVTVTYSEDMNTSINATITFSNGTWTAGTGSWTDATHFARTYTLTDNNETFTNVDITVTAAKDVAGNTQTQGDGTDKFDIETIGPTVAVSLNDSSLIVGQTALVTFTFSEAVINFANADLTIDNGALTDVASADGNITWTAVFTPTDDLEDAINNITIGTTWSDVLGNAPVAGNNTANYVIDTKEPTVTVTMNDTALKVDDTALVTFTFSEAIINFANADLTIDNGALTDVASADGNITWTAVFTPTDDLEDAINNITIGTVWADVLGNAPIAGNNTANYAIDTKEPTVAITMNDSSLIVGQTALVTFTFNGAVINFANADLTIDNGALTDVASADGNITWTATFTPTDNIEDAINNITIGTVWADVAGNAPLAGNNSANYVIDTIEPTVTVTMNDTALKVDDTALVTFTFSEAIINFANADLTIDNGALTDVASADGNITWTAVFTPTDDLEDAINNITIGTTWNDVLGNAPIAGNNTANYAIDTKEPTVAITMNDSSLIVGQTALVTFTFNGAVINFANADLTIDNGALTDVASADGNITWTATFTPTDNIEDAINNITIGTVWADVAGNAPLAGNNTANYVIDTIEPTVAIIMNDTALKVGDTALVTFTFSEAIINFANADVTTIDNGNLTTVASADGNITWTAVFTPTDNIEDATNNITIGTTWNDVLGNTPIAGNNTANYAIDTKEPTVALTYSVNPAKAGVLTITATYSEAVVGTPQISINQPGTTDVTNQAMSGGATVWTYNYTVVAASSPTYIDGTATVSLSTVTDDALNNAEAPTNTTFTIDTTGPVHSITNPAAGSTVSSPFELAVDTDGTAAGCKYNENSSFTYATNGTAMTASGGTSFTATISAANGAKTYYVICADTANNTVERSRSFTVSTDVTSPTVTLISNVSTQTTVPIVFQSSETGTASVKYGITESYGFQTGWQAVTADTNTTITLAGLSCGTLYHYTVYARDASSNEGNSSDATFNTSACTPGDTTAPTGLAITTEDATVNSDYYTISGTLTADSTAVTVQVLKNGTLVVGTVVVTAGQTTWSVVVPLGQAAVNNFTARATDASGNPANSTSNADDSLKNVVITESASAGADTTAPLGLVVNTPTTPTDQSTAAISGNLTADATNVVIQVYNDVDNDGTIDAGVDYLVGEITIADGTTTWGLSVPLQLQSANNFVVIAIDAYGNPTAPVNVPTITQASDITAPTLTSATPTGTTNDTTPAISIVFSDETAFNATAANNLMTLTLDGASITPDVLTVVGTTLTVGYTPGTAIADGVAHTVYVKVKDLAGNTKEFAWTFTVNTGSGAFYAFDMPGNSIGFTAARVGRIISNYELAGISGWAVGWNLSNFLNASAGSAAQRLNTSDVNAVYIYASATEAWTTYANTTFATWDFDEHDTAFIGYYVFNLKTSAAGKSIRHS